MGIELQRGGVRQRKRERERDRDRKRDRERERERERWRERDRERESRTASLVCVSDPSGVKYTAYTPRPSMGVSLVKSKKKKAKTHEG